jgi:hypothetical protein
MLWYLREDQITNVQELLANGIFTRKSDFASSLPVYLEKYYVLKTASA